MARARGYGQFCPVSQAAEVVAGRWTPLILRELICGSRRFNDLRRGLPLMSPALLSKRLKELEAAGVIERRPAPKGTGTEYQLTPSGEALRPVIELLGLWGLRWLRREPRQDELDPALLMWDVRRCVDATFFPADRRTVVEFTLAGVPVKKSRYWLVFERGEADLCVKDPGHEVSLYVAAHVRELAAVWVGRTELRAAAIELDGSRTLVRGFAAWFRLSAVARLAQTQDTLR